MRKRILSALVAAILCLNLLLPVPAGALTVTDDDVIRAVLVVFRCREGTYDSVNRDDNGALSLGKLQWHGVRALELMKEICASDPSNALAILGDPLFREITGAGRDAWNGRTLNAEEAALFSRVLALPSSVRIQDAIAKKDISGYIAHARTYDIRTAEAMVYYCDIENQYGPGGAADLVSRVKDCLGKDSIESVEEFHGALIQVTSNYLSRRFWTYLYCCNLDWSNLDAGVTDYEAPVIPRNLDVEPPKITSARIVPLDGERFQVEVGAKDNKKVTDCRVQIGTDADEKQERAEYAKASGTFWVLPVSIDKYDAAATRFYVTVTVSDASGNGTSAHLEIAKSELADPESACEHRFAEVEQTQATCTEPAYRVERCEYCGLTRQIPGAPPRGHTVAPGGNKCSVCGEAVEPQEQSTAKPGILEQAARKIIESCQKQMS